MLSLKTRSLLLSANCHILRNLRSLGRRLELSGKARRIALVLRGHVLQFRPFVLSLGGITRNFAAHIRNLTLELGDELGGITCGCRGQLLRRVDGGEWRDDCITDRDGLHGGVRRGDDVAGYQSLLLQGLAQRCKGFLRVNLCLLALGGQHLREVIPLHDSQSGSLGHLQHQTVSLVSLFEVHGIDAGLLLHAVQRAVERASARGGRRARVDVSIRIEKRHSLVRRALHLLDRLGELIHRERRPLHLPRRRGTRWR